MRARVSALGLTPAAYVNALGTSVPRLCTYLSGNSASSQAPREEPHATNRHTVVYTAGSIEIRDYAPVILAQVQVAGGMGDAGNRGFRPLAGYIFGDNRRPGGSRAATTGGAWG